MNLRALLTRASLLLMTLISTAAPHADVPTYLVFVGTYTGAGSQGIYSFRFDATTGQATPLGLAAETVHPTFLDLHPGGRFLYAVGETGSFEGKPAGSVSAFEIDRDTGRLTRLNAASTVGTGPCHLVVDRTGRNVLVANYGGGSVAVLPIDASGRVGEATAFVQHQGSSVNPRRQQGPHAHGVTLSPDQRFVFVPDLGLDRILAYRFDAARGSLTPAEIPYAATQPGAGPRHFVFHPNGKSAFVINELDSTITTYTYDATRGSLSRLGTVSTLPRGFTGASTTAEIEIHPSGKFLYGSNRGHDSLALFSVTPATGRLARVEITSTGGKTPRNFAIDPTGRWLWAANQDSNRIGIFAIDPATGRLKPTETALEVGAPVCVKFLALE